MAAAEVVADSSASTTCGNSGIPVEEEATIDNRGGGGGKGKGYRGQNIMRGSGSNVANGAWALGSPVSGVHSADGGDNNGSSARGACPSLVFDGENRR